MDHDQFPLGGSCRWFKIKFHTFATNILKTWLKFDWNAGNLKGQKSQISDVPHSRTSLTLWAEFRVLIVRNLLTVFHHIAILGPASFAKWWWWFLSMFIIYDDISNRDNDDIVHQRLNGTLPTDPEVSCDRAIIWILRFFPGSVQERSCWRFLGYQQHDGNGDLPTDGFLFLHPPSGGFGKSNTNNKKRCSFCNRFPFWEGFGTASFFLGRSNC